MKHLKIKASFVLMIAMILFSSLSVFAQDLSPDVAEAAKTTASNINWLIAGIAILLVFIIGMIFDILTKVGDVQKKQVINWGKINAYLALVFLVVGMGAFAWEMMVHGKLTVFTLPAASAHADEYDNMFMITLWLTGIVFVITHILLFWYTYKYKEDKKRKALFYPDNHKLELLWTIVPAAVLTILVVRGLIVWSNMTTSKDKDAMNIEVFGYQFAWNARYSGADNKLGKYDFRQMGIVNALGVDSTREFAGDDVITTELHVPVNKAIYLHFRSKDVIHSAYLPHFRVQMNVVPGLPTKFDFTPTLTTNEMRAKLENPNFDYILLCNKICGSAHYRMKMKVIVDTQAEFDKWIKEQPALTAKGTETNSAHSFLSKENPLASN
ncbi:MAG: cytochrome c oxidase subunit II [Bacteroidia bacterium]